MEKHQKNGVSGATEPEPIPWFRRRPSASAVLTDQDRLGSPRREVTRRRGRRVGVLTAAAATLALGVALLPIQAPTASAYNAGDCSSPASKVHDVDYIWFNGGAVDFGGGWHSNGKPPDNAIVCWNLDQKLVQLRGTMYLDAGADLAGSVRVVLRFHHTDGTVISSGSTNFDLSDAEGDDTWSSSHDFNRSVTPDNNKKVGKVSVYGYIKSAATNNQWALVRERHVKYGDPD